MNFKSKAKAAMAATAAVAGILSPLASTTAVRTAAVAATGVTLATFSSVASAQTNKRICGGIMKYYSDGFAGAAMEVNKFDFVTCTLFVNTFVKEPVVTAGLRFTIPQALINKLGGYEPPKVYLMSTCENMTRGTFPPGAYGGDICHSMTDYKIYAYQVSLKGYSHWPIRWW